MHSEVAGGEQCEVRHVSRAAQALTVRAGRITHWGQRARLESQPQPVEVYPWSPNIFLSAGKRTGHRRLAGLCTKSQDQHLNV